MSKKELIASLYAHAAWANAKLLDQVARLSEAKYRDPMSAEYRSVHETLVHTLLAEWRWFEAWRGDGQPPANINADDLTTLDLIRARWAELREQRAAFIASLTESDLEAQLSRTRGGRTSTFLRWQAMTTVALHGVQHRAEIAQYLTAAGFSPGDLDFIFYVMSQPPPS
ncbi:MAG: DinB family protein [Chloroflexi bacterium]|nr:DinB family protein [Chloroflexota bacterium]